MTEEVAQASPGSGPPDVSTRTDSVAAPERPARLRELHAQGAHLRDPVRWRYLEALAQRATARTGTVHAALDARLTAAMADYMQRTGASPVDVAPTRRVSAATTPLRALVDALDTAQGGVGDLKALHQFRDDWAQLSVSQQLARAVDEAPENAGPLNSQLLVLNTLERLRAIAPGYLNRFVPYVDALLWCERANIGRPMSTATTAAATANAAPLATKAPRATQGAALAPKRKRRPTSGRR